MQCKFFIIFRCFFNSLANLAQTGGGTNCITGFNSIQSNQLPNSRAGAIPVIITITDGVDANSPSSICNKVQNIRSTNGVQNFIGVFNCPQDGNAQCASLLQSTFIASLLLTGVRCASSNALRCRK